MSSPASALTHQVGYVLESVVGRPATVTETLPSLSLPTLYGNVEIMKSNSIRAGRRVATSADDALGAITVSGGTNHEFFNIGMEVPLTLMFGTPVKTGAGPYTRTYTMADLAGIAATVQVGLPTSTTGSVLPRTYSGVKCQSWEMAVAAGEWVTLALDCVGIHEVRYRQVTDGVTTNASTAITSATAAFSPDDVGKPITGTNIPANTTIAAVTSTTAATLSAAATGAGTGITFTIGVALAASSYPASQVPFTFVHASATCAGTTVKFRSCKVKGTMGLDDDRRFCGQRYIDEALEAEHRTVRFSFDVEFADDTHYTKFMAGTEIAVVLALASGADTFTMTANCYYAENPKPAVGGKGILHQTLELECVASGADSTALTAVLVNSVA